MKKKILTLLFLLASPLLIAQEKTTTQPKAKVYYVSLAEGQTITSNSIQEHPQSESIEASNVIKLYPQIQHQTISGIGGCFNEIGGEALSHLDDQSQQQLLSALFDNSNGGDMAYCRMSIGASDFGIDAYSFSEVADDYQMENFSMERESQYMLPYIKKAVETNSDIKIFGSPWSPPSWMKYSGYMDRGIEFPEQNRLIDSPEIYSAYALYFAKFIEAYQKEGIEIDRIIIQNEQDIATKYPSCVMPVEQMSHFVQSYLRPLFTKKQITTQIWGGTFRTYGELAGVEFASNKLYNKDFDGIGIQYTSPQYINEIRTVAPELNLMHTESNCFDGGNSFEQAKSRFEEVASYINGGSENFAYWNMILNESGLSGWGWRQNSLITIDRNSGSVVYNPDYLVMNFLASIIKPNSVRISTFSTQTVITVESEGRYYVVLQNNSDQAQTYKCDVEGRVVNVEIPALSLCAIEL